MSQNASPSNRLASLDWLRLLAALAVVAYHYLFRGAAADGYLSEGYPEVAPQAIYGYLGVNLFFLVSGFVIAWSAEGRGWLDFAIARFARIYPGFVVSMTLTFVILWFAAPAWGEVSVRQYLANLVMFSPALGQPFVDGVYWSIILELIFYFWVALALMTGVFHRWKLELVAGWLVVSALNEFVIGSGAMRLLFLTEYGPLFAAGILVHHIHARGRSAEGLILLAAAFGLSTSLMGVARDWMQGHYGVSVPMGGLVLANIAIHAVLIAAIRFGASFRPTGLSLALGGLTYPLYLLHQNIGFVLIDDLAPHIGRWPAAALVTATMFLLAWSVWRFVEPPLRRTLVVATRQIVERVGLRTGDPRPA